MTKAVAELNQLAIIVKDAGLEGAKATYIIEQFQDCFKLAAEWEAKAKTIVVTRPDQKSEMEQAREGRLFLREKRIAIENSRKKLKEDVLKEGRAIDSIAGTLKALIEPIETYLDAQEHFVELEQKKKDDAHRAEVERRMAEEDAARQKAEAEKAQKLQAENEKLRIERDKAAAKLKIERDKAKEAELKAEAEARAAKAKADAEKAKIEEKARLEREKAQAAIREADQKAAEARAKDKARADRKLAEEREEKERL